VTMRLLSQELATLGLDLESTLREGSRFLLDARFLGALHGELAPRPLASGRLRFAGGWPERYEAEAVTAALGGRAGPACHVSAGYTSGWLSGIFDGDVLVCEEACAAAGHAQCRFVAAEAAEWIEGGDSCGRAGLVALPFAALREAVMRYVEPHAAGPTERRGDAFEAGAPVVHVWGPVMVIPFSGPEESLRALELIGRDPGARHVRVVIVDLSGTLIDDGFGAAALEQILDAIEGWGAEPILTGVSPLSARVVADLEKAHLVLQKDLPDAIAAGFQIADAQRQIL